MTINLVYRMMRVLVKHPTMSFIVEVVDTNDIVTEGIVGDYRYKKGTYPLYTGVKDIIEENAIHTNNLDFYDYIIENYSDNKFFADIEHCGKKYITNRLFSKVKILSISANDIEIRLHSIRDSKLLDTVVYTVLNITDTTMELEDDYGDSEIIKK